jgi:hypothetical protein
MELTRQSCESKYQRSSKIAGSVGPVGWVGILEVLEHRSEVLVMGERVEAEIPPA